MTNVEYAEQILLIRKVYSPVKYGEKPLPWLAVFVSWGGLSAGSNYKIIRLADPLL
jgi:hypothetical protein